MPDNALSFNITASGSPTAGSQYTLTCEVSLAVSGLANTPTAVWSGDGSDPTVSSDGSQSTLTFPNLRTLQGGNYFCQGRLESPALEQPLVVMQIQTVIVESKCSTVRFSVAVMTSCVQFLFQRCQ